MAVHWGGRGPGHIGRQTTMSSLAVLSLDLTNGIVSPRISTAQASVTWAENANGSLTKFAANTPRQTNLGLWVDGAVTELLGSDTDTAGWTLASSSRTGSQTAPDGTTTANRYTDASAVAYGNVNKTTTVTVAAGTYIASIRVNKESSGANCYTWAVNYKGNTADQNSSLYIDPVSGTVTQSGGMTTIGSIDKGTYWIIYAIRTVTAHTSIQHVFYPSTRATVAGADNVALTGSTTIWMPNVVSGSTLTMPSVGNRSADATTISLPAGDSSDIIIVTYGASATKAVFRRSDLASANVLNLASDYGAPWLNSYVSKVEVYTALGAIQKTINALAVSSATGGQPTTSSSSPTITYGAKNAAATLTGSLISWDATGKFNLMGGAWSTVGASFPDNLIGTARNWTGETGTPTRFGTGSFVEFYHTGDAFEIYQKGYDGFVWRLWVDGQVSANAYPSVPTSPDTQGGFHYTLVSFGSSATRRIRLEVCNGGYTDFVGVQVKTGQTITATPPKSLKVGILGDSFTGGTGATLVSGSGFAALLAHELGDVDYRVSGSGGTGWVQTNTSAPAVPGGVACNLQDRWQLDAITPNLDVVIVAMGYNDLGDGNDATIQTAAATKFAALRAACPSTLIICLGPWDSNAYAGNPPSSDCVNLTAALEAACATVTGCYFFSMAGVAFEPVGGGDIHPTQAGHNALYQNIYSRIAARFGFRSL